MDQKSFSDVRYAIMKMRTRREVFLAEMERVVQWCALLAEIGPCYPADER